MEPCKGNEQDGNEATDQDQKRERPGGISCGTSEDNDDETDGNDATDQDRKKERPGGTAFGTREDNDEETMLGDETNDEQSLVVRTTSTHY